MANPWLDLAKAGAGAAAAVFALKLQKAQRGGPHKPTRKVWVIAVTWKFKSQADKEKLIKIWTPLAEYVAKHEPNTLAYEMSFSEDDPLKVFLYERYVNKSDWNVTHQSAQIYKDFFKQVDDEHLLASSDVQFYTESDIGFC
ncbi:hypothetical protein WJX84_000369 [Apatococcus fuscideae]|uniref:ABM domain-containing protein n=1 Tax=Apatococcus fuscideae TaxID=2026836 RepID=A0AAW1T9Y7_9CHLO